NDYAVVAPPQLPLGAPLTAVAPDGPSSADAGFWGYNGKWLGVIVVGNSGYNGGGSTHFVPYTATNMASISDGTSNTIAVAEKFVPINHYTDGYSGDDK